MLGEWDEALATAPTSLPELERSEAGSDLVIVRTQEAVLRVCRGEAGLAAPFLDWLEQRGLESEIPWISAYALLAVGARPLRTGADRSSAATPRRVGDAAAARQRPELRGLPARGGADGARGRRRRTRRPPLDGDRLDPADAAQRPRLAARPAQRAATARRRRRRRTSRTPPRRWNDFRMPYEEAHALLGRGRCLKAWGGRARRRSRSPPRARSSRGWGRAPARRDGRAAGLGSSAVRQGRRVVHPADLPPPCRDGRTCVAAARRSMLPVLHT